MSDDLSGDMLAPSWPNLVISVVTLTPLFSKRQYKNFTDDNQIIDILSSVLCQIKECAKICSQAIPKFVLGQY